MDARQWHIGLVGYGEVGRILAEDLRAQDVAVHACDVKLDSAAAARARCAITPGRTACACIRRTRRSQPRPTLS